MPKGKAIKWTDEMVQWCKDNRVLYGAEPFTQAFNNHFGTSTKKTTLIAMCKRQGIFTGRKGSEIATVWNKGTKGVMKRNHTSFRVGRKSHNRRPVGSLRLTASKVSNGVIVEQGQWWVKMGEPKHWVRLARVAWEAYNGPIPAGHVLVSLDLDPNNCCNPDNFELLSRAELVALNHRNAAKYADAPIEQRRSLIAIARLNAKLGKLRKAA